MNKEFVPYDIALDLKELGFDEPVCGFYYKLNKPKEQVQDVAWTKMNSEASCHIPDYYISAPLYQQAFRWLRSEYHLVHDIKPVWVGRPIMEKYEYTIYFHSNTGRSYVTGSGSSESMEKYIETEIVCLREIIKEAKKLKNVHNIYH